MSANKLMYETSPYLIQHANNPVHWLPWGDEAFEKAKREEKPVFLSIGYSTCHWCHVMAHESFEDNEVAELLNSRFIAIKVDKEERPDVDSVYMRVCQMLTGSGGWPLTIIMTPDKRAFYAATYLPKHNKYGRFGIIEILNRVSMMWQTDREKLLDSADSIEKSLKAEKGEKENTKDVDIEQLIYDCYESMNTSYDETHGGFGGAPKFPMPHGILFLLDFYKARGQKRALSMAEHTLEAMYRGGIFDHIGFGFSRYSTDDMWLVPHFEKMLYDNALLIMAYAKAYDFTKKPLYKEVAEKTIQYIIREMTDASGAFFSAQDADSEGEEGKYYVFAPSEITALIPEPQAGAFCRHYGITARGNFEGKNIPNLIGKKLAPNASFENLLPIIYEYRKERMKLHKDDKILSAWNGLMIGALARAYTVFGNKVYFNAAEHAASFVIRQMTNDNRVFTSYRAHKCTHTAFLDDAAYMVFGLIELHRAEKGNWYLDTAEKLMKRAVDEFMDKERGGFYLYGHSAESLPTRPKESYDGAIPSGNAVMAYNLYVLSRLRGSQYYSELLDLQTNYLAREAADYAGGHMFFLFTALKFLNPPMVIHVALKRGADRVAACEGFPPDALVMVIEGGDENYPLVDSHTTYYICDNDSCRPPVNENPFYADITI